MFARVLESLLAVAIVLLVLTGIAAVAKEPELVELLVNIASVDLLAIMFWGIVAVPHPEKVRQ